MRKSIAVLLILAVSSLCQELNAQYVFKQKDEDMTCLYPEKLHGRVKSIRESAYTAKEKFGEIECGILKHFFSFSSDYDRVRSEVAEKKYDEKNRIIEEWNVSFNGYDTLFLRTKFIYNDKGQCVEENDYVVTGDLIYKYLYEYNTHGDILVIEGYNKKELQSRCVFSYEYDPAGRITKRESRDYGKEIFSYDDNGCITIKRGYGIDYYNENGDFIKRDALIKESCRYTYDEYGNWIKKITYTAFENETPGAKLVTIRAIEYR